jgi:AraC family ethanolamine operon transcriptional activator
MFASAPRSLPPIAKYFGEGAYAGSDAASLHFNDAQEQASALTGWNQDYLQLTAGAFHGEISQLQGSGIKLFIEQVQQSVFQTGVLPSGVLAVGIPLDSIGNGMFCGNVCGADDFHVFSGASGFEFRSSRQHTMLGVELQLGQNWLGGERGLPHQACALRVTPQALSELKTYLLTLFQSAKASPSLLSTPAVVSTVADFLLDHMAQVDPQRHAASDSRAHWAMVQKACALVQDRVEQAPTVAQLCVDLGVSRRTLQNGFQRVLDVSPLAYLKALRLGQARQALKEVESVTEAATACGFWHFGHFSQDYQTMFGERPSDTLRRQRG